MANSTEDTVLVRAVDVTKRYGTHLALDRASFMVERGRIVGVIGPNGAGKTTAVRAILGLVRCEGSLRVLGRNPFSERTQLMRDASFMADVAIMPDWLKVGQALDLFSAIHPNFRRERAEHLIDAVGLQLRQRIGELSKGLKTQVHLAIALAIDAKLLVLDEPTLGLDPLARRSFYEILVNEYLDDQRTIVVTTNEIEELEGFLTDIVLLDRGRVLLQSTVPALTSHYVAVEVAREAQQAATARRPFYARPILGGQLMYFESTHVGRIEELGRERPLSISELSVALLSRQV